MKSFLKFLTGTFAVMFFLSSCDDANIVKQEPVADGSGIAAAIPVPPGLPRKHCGCPSGPDVVDGNGNVIVNRDVFFNNDTVYVIHNFFRVQDTKTLEIEAGTWIVGAKTTDTGCSSAPAAPKPGAVIIERGAMIDAEGTVDAPIVFTSNQITANRAPGDWAGVVLLGKANIALSSSRGAFPSGTNGLGFIEGLQVPNNLGRYGNGDLAAGNYESDNSGILKYVRIEYAGFIIGEANELNGLTLGGVGCGTTLDYIQVSFGADDGFEFFGGSVNGKHLIAYNNGDDDFDTDQGYNGLLQFGVSVRSQNGNWLSAAPLNGTETNGDDDDDVGTELLTSAQLSNFTFIGPFQNNCGGTVNTNYDAGAYFRDATNQDIYNSVVAGFPKGIRFTDSYLTEYNTSATPDVNKVDVRNTSIAVPVAVTGFTMSATWDNPTSANFDATFLTAPLSNVIYAAGECTENPTTPARTMATHLGLNTTAWNGAAGSMPNLNPISTSPLLGTASFSGLDTTDNGCVNDFFDSAANYRGAFGQSGNWMATWSAW